MKRAFVALKATAAAEKAARRAAAKAARREAKEAKTGDNVVMQVELEDLQEDDPEEGRQVPKRNLREESQKTSPGRVYKEADLWHNEGVPDEALWEGMQREMSFLHELRVYAWAKVTDLPPGTEIF